MVIKKIGLLLAITVVLISAGCSDSGSKSSGSKTPPTPAASERTQFTITVDPQEVVASQGESVTAKITVVRSEGFNEPIEFSLQGAPIGVKGEFIPPSTSPTGTTSSLALYVGWLVRPGRYDLMINARGGHLTSTATVRLVVKGFGVRTSPSVFTMKQGGSVDIEVIIERYGDFSEEITLSVAGTGPGLMAIISPARVTTKISSAILRVITSYALDPGRYTLTVVGKWKGSEAKAEFLLVVEALYSESSTDAVVATIPVGREPCHMVIVGRKAFVAARASDAVVVIDLDNNSVVDTFFVPPRPHKLAAIGTKLYVAVDKPKLIVLDQNTGAQLKTIEISTPTEMQMYGDRLFLPGRPDIVASVIDTKSDRVIKVIQGGYSNTIWFSCFAFWKDKVYLCRAPAGPIHVFDSATLQEVGTINAGGGIHMAVAANKAYIAGFWNNDVSVLDLERGAQLTLIKDLPFGGALGPIPSFVFPAGQKVYVLNRGAAAVTVIDVATDKVVATIPVGKLPEHMVSISGRGFVANSGSDTVSVIDLSSDKVVSTIRVGNRPVFLTVAGTMLYVVNEGSGTVSVVDTTKIP